MKLLLIIKHLQIIAGFNMLLHKFIQYLNDNLPLYKISIVAGEVVILVAPQHLFIVSLFLKNHTQSQFSLLSCISGVDYPQDEQRFEIVYDLLSLRFNSRVRLKVRLFEIEPIVSLTSVFVSADWWEREVWDMFGIFFLDHPNLCRLLTDYGFRGHPLRKDFPLTGFTEVFYNLQKKGIMYQKIEFAQMFRNFNFTDSWGSFSLKNAY